MARTQEIADGIYVIATDDYRLNTGLILGAEKAMVIDTGAGPRHGAEIFRAVRKVTDLPLAVVNTHAHYDHFFGNAVFAADGVTDFWAHPKGQRAIETYGNNQRAFVETLEPEMAHHQGPNTDLVVPNRLLPGDGGRASFTRVELGERAVTLFYLGLGHTDHDVLAGVDEVLFTGDVVEQGADPAFSDSFPEVWVQTLETIAGLDRYSIFVPGHGSPVERAFVQRQAKTMREAIRRIRASTSGDQPGPTTAAMYKLPYDAGVTRELLDRLEWLKSQGLLGGDLELADTPEGATGPVIKGEAH